MQGKKSKQNNPQIDLDYENAVTLFSHIPDEQLIMMGYNGIHLVCFLFSLDIQMMKEKGPGNVS